MEHDASQDSVANLPRGRVELSTQILQEAPEDAAQILLGLHKGVEVVGSPPKYVHVVGEVGLAEQGIAEMALAEKASTKDDDVAEKAFLARDIPENTKMHDVPKETGAAEEETLKYEIGSRDNGSVGKYEIGSLNGEGVAKTAMPTHLDAAKTAVPALLDAEIVMAETALAKAKFEDRSKGKPLKTSPSAPSLSWNQVLQRMGIGSTLGYDPISRS